MSDVTEVVQPTEQQVVEQEALAKYHESQKSIKDSVSGISDEVPEGYTPDGEKIESLTEEPILGKFKSQEDLVKAYQELEKKLSQGDETQPAVEEETVGNEGDNTVEKPDGTQFNIEKFDNEFRESGELSDASYKELEANGFNKDSVDRYIAGQKALVEQYTNSIYTFAGGEESYTTLVAWAGEAMDNGTLSKSVVEEFNIALNIGNLEKVQSSLEFINYKRDVSMGENRPVTRVKGSSQSEGGMKAFSDKGAWQQATANPLYGKDVKYTTMIDKKYLASKRAGTIS